MTNPLHNLLKSPTDPLKAGPHAGRVLSERFGEAANGFGKEHVLDAAVSVLLDLVRQTQQDRTSAHAALDELTAKMHEVLEKHYDPVTGKRRHVFAYDQNINLEFVRG